MFLCSICNETFYGDQLDSTCTTRCGHVFHSQCLKSWLKRSRTCPHCRSKVIERNLIKLFLQVDPADDRIANDKKIDEEIKSLRNQLKMAREIESQSIASIVQLKYYLKQVQKTITQKDTDINELTHVKNSYQVLNSELEDQLKVLKEENNSSKELAKTFEIQYSIEREKNALEKELNELKSVIIKELQFEVDDLKAQKAYFQNLHQQVENEHNVQQSSSSKVNFENKTFTSHEIELENETHEQGSQSKIPSKNELLGCVFLIVEDQKRCANNVCSDTLMSELKIIQHGGKVEHVYSCQITHLICATQKHHLVARGIKDGKRCVTKYWLNDVITNGSISPPWLAHHFPTPFSNDIGLPCPHFEIAITNFYGNEYHRVKTMVELTGAHFVNEFSSKTDIVISLKLENELIETALANNKPVVNVQWLNNILLNGSCDIEDSVNSKYRDFNLPNPFVVNHDMVSHLMEAWKTPINHLKSQQTYYYDLTKSPTSSGTKRKTEEMDDSAIKSSQLIDLINTPDDDDLDDIVITYAKIPKKQ